MVKKFLLLTSVIIVVLGLFAVQAGATPITGHVSFNGTFIPEDGSGNATNLGSAEYINIGNDTTVKEASGDFSDLNNLIGYVNYSSFYLNSNSPLILWSVDFNSSSYSFDLNETVIVEQSDAILRLKGAGILKISGFEDTAALWSFGGGPSTSGGTFTVQSEWHNCVAVPEPGTSAMLGFFFTALGIFGFRYREHRVK